MAFVALLLLVVSVGAAREHTDDDMAKFPKLFHLDEYERCLARVDGVYCLGTFDLTPAKLPHPTYELMKTYTEKTWRNFNRTRIHRGYCLSTRCSTQIPASLRMDKNTSLDFERNPALRFERCADHYARASGFRASLQKFDYCRTHTDTISVQPLTTAEQIFKLVICALVLANIVGTIYDNYAGDSPNKNTFLSAFSIPMNWRRLTIIHEGGDSRLTALAPIHGLRVVIMGLITLGHAGTLHYMIHTVNPEYLEQLTERWYYTIMRDSVSLIQAFVVVTCFLTGYLLLIISQKHELSLQMLPLCIIKRVVRMAPIHVLIVGYGATWWLKSRDAPLVPTVIGLESDACKAKFWSHVFFMNNIVDNKNFCVSPTWFLSMNMHVYILACILTLLLWRRRSFAIRLYAVLFTASCLLFAIVSYINEYKAFPNFVSPEQTRRLYRDTPTITELYMSSWGALPSCFMGLIFAHIQFELDERKIKLSEYKWFVYLHYAALPAWILWSFTGTYVQGNNSRLFNAIYFTLDRFIFCISSAFHLLALFNIDGPLSRFFGWRGWHSLARMSLTVMLMHWCVNFTIVTRPAAFSTSVFDIIVDWAATTLITYVIAVPITVLVELPMQKFLDALFLDKIINAHKEKIK